MNTPTDTLTISDEKLELIKRTVAKGATNDELELFLYTAKRTGLDPLTRQIYCIKRGNQMAIQTGIDGYRAIADRTGKYAGNDDPVFDREEKPRIAKVTVYKIVEGQKCAFSSSARWDQYYPGLGKSPLWDKMPHLMLGKCAEALALRKAFPQQLSGVYTKEEMDQADSNGLETGRLPERPVAANPAPKKALPENPTLWEGKVIEVPEPEEQNGKMVYSVQFEGGRIAKTINQDLADKAYTLMNEDADRTFKAMVKPGRYPGTHVLVSIE